MGTSGNSCRISNQALSRMEHVYTTLCRHNSESHSVVGYRDRDSQRLCYQLSTEVGNLNNASIIDVGCGLGDLYGFLRSKYSSFRYVGIDISMKMIENAREAYPGTIFEKADILTYESSENFDWAYSIGIYNIELSDNDFIMHQIIKKMFRITTKGLAVCMTYGCNLPHGTHSFDPVSMYLFGRSLTPCLNLSINDNINGFVLFLYH